MDLRIKFIVAAAATFASAAIAQTAPAPQAVQAEQPKQAKDPNEISTLQRQQFLKRLFTCTNAV